MQRAAGVGYARGVYVLRAPHPALAPFIEHYWFVSAEDGPVDLRVEVFVDARADLVFVRIAGVRFRLGGLAPFSRVRLRDFTDRTVRRERDGRGARERRRRHEPADRSAVRAPARHPAEDGRTRAPVPARPDRR